MQTIILGSLIISVLHALLPNHWLPIVAIGRQERWTVPQVLTVTFWAGLAHVISTLALGLVLAATGQELAYHFESFTRWGMPVVLVGLGLVFLYRHYRHLHFHMESKNGQGMSSLRRIGGTLAVAMFFSPCLEVEGYFLAAGTHGWYAVILLSAIYVVTTLGGMLFWVYLAYRGMQQFNWHTLEHNAGLLTGCILIVTGIISFFIQ
jgi:hypothetical protein